VTLNASTLAALDVCANEICIRCAQKKEEIAERDAESINLKVDMAIVCAGRSSGQTRDSDRGG
jgi:hypothetical protein